MALAIADFSDDGGRSFPSMKTLAGKAALSERAAQAAIRDLIELGELRIEANAGPHGVNFYHLTITPADIAGGNNCGGADIAALPPQILRGGVQILPPTPAISAPKPSVTVREPSGNRQGNAREEFTTRWFPESLRDEAFKTRWEEWEEHCQELSKPIGSSARRGQLVECDKNGRDISMKALQFSISNNRNYIAWSWQSDSETRKNGQKHTSTRNEGHNAGVSYANRPKPAAGGGVQPPAH